MQKFTILRGFILARRWANTEKGEKIIVSSLTSMVFVLYVCASLLLIGYFS